MIVTGSIREYALDLVNACLGLISPNVRTIALQPVGDGAYKVHFFLWKKSAATVEDIDCILEDFEALQSKPLQIDCEVHINSSESIDRVPAEVIYIYRAKGTT